MKIEGIFLVSFVVLAGGEENFEGKLLKLDQD